MFTFDPTLSSAVQTGAPITTIAGIAAVAAFISAGVMLILGGLGLWHARRVPAGREFLGQPAGTHEALPA